MKNCTKNQQSEATKMWNDFYYQEHGCYSRLLPNILQSIGWLWFLFLSFPFVIYVTNVGMDPFRFFRFLLSFTFTGVLIPSTLIALGEEIRESRAKKEFFESSETREFGKVLGFASGNVEQNRQQQGLYIMMVLALIASGIVTGILVYTTP